MNKIFIIPIILLTTTMVSAEVIYPGQSSGQVTCRQRPNDLSDDTLWTLALTKQLGECTLEQGLSDDDVYWALRVKGQFKDAFFQFDPHRVRKAAYALRELVSDGVCNY